MCIPIIGANLCNFIGKRIGNNTIFNGKSLLIIGSFGILPDLVNPHIYLEDRLNSWSHTVWFILGLSLLLLTLKRLGLIWGYALIIGCVLASAMHIICDGITGGVKPFYPFDIVVGKYFIGSNHWIELDVIFLILAIASYYVSKMRQNDAT